MVRQRMTPPTGAELSNPWGDRRQKQSTTKTTPLRYSVGVDLGQAGDYTAVCVLEKTIAPPSSALFYPVGGSPADRLVEGKPILDLRYLKRPALGTPYDRIAERVADLVIKLEPKGAFDEIGQIILSVDGTGVGRGIVDMLRAEFTKRSARGEYTPKIDFRPVTVTGSNSAPRPPRHRGDYWAIPKPDLVFPTVVAFQQQRLRIAGNVNDKTALIEELSNYRRTTNIATGNMTFEPWREAAHDDLLFALALSLWGWQQGTPRRRVRAVQ